MKRKRKDIHSVRNTKNNNKVIIKANETTATIILTETVGSVAENTRDQKRNVLSLIKDVRSVGKKTTSSVGTNRNPMEAEVKRTSAFVASISGRMILIPATKNTASRSHAITQIKNSR